MRRWHGKTNPKATEPSASELLGAPANQQAGPLLGGSKPKASSRWGRHQTVQDGEGPDTLSALFLQPPAHPGGHLDSESAVSNSRCIYRTVCHLHQLTVSHQGSRRWHCHSHFLALTTKVLKGKPQALACKNWSHDLNPDLSNTQVYSSQKVVSCSGALSPLHLPPTSTPFSPHPKGAVSRKLDLKNAPACLLGRRLISKVTPEADSFTQSPQSPFPPNQEALDSKG